jgi:hypothetical protein
VKPVLAASAVQAVRVASTAAVKVEPAVQAARQQTRALARP